MKQTPTNCGKFEDEPGMRGHCKNCGGTYHEHYSGKVAVQGLTDKRTDPVEKIGGGTDAFGNLNDLSGCDITSASLKDWDNRSAGIKIEQERNAILEIWREDASAFHMLDKQCQRIPLTMAAAAPELLEALKATLLTIGSYAQSGDFPRASEFALAHAAIAKSEGMVGSPLPMHGEPNDTDAQWRAKYQQAMETWAEESCQLHAKNNELLEALKAIVECPLDAPMGQMAQALSSARAVITQNDK